MRKIKKIIHRVAALSMSCFLTLGLIAPAFTIRAKAEALEVLNSACTVADMVFSYCASGGVAIMNTSVISEVYDVLGSSFGTVQTFVDNGLLTYSNGQYVDTGLSISIESTLQSVESIDIGSLFNQTAQQNPNGVALSGAGTLAGIAGSVATTGVLPVVAGVAVSGYCGFQIGTLIANFLGLYDDNMGLGVNINISQDIVNSMPKGSQVVYASETVFGDFREYYHFGNGVPFSYINNGYVNFGYYNPSNSKITITKMYLVDHYINSTNTSDLNSKNYYTAAVQISRGGRGVTPNNFNSFAEWNTARSNWSNGGSYNKVKSPDVIGSNGNIEGTYNNETQKYNYPNVIPRIDPENESVNPTGLTFDDYINYANNALINYTDGDPDSNKDIFDDILSKIKIDEPTPNPNPDPEPDPNPGTVPVPTPTPNPDYDVDQPDTNAPESETPETDPDLSPPDFVLPNLMDKFPFCIPNDIATIFGKFRNENRQAPYISWRFNPPGTPIDYTFNLNLSDFEEVAALLRTLELIAFVVGLAYATRYLIGSS